MVQGIIEVGLIVKLRRTNTLEKTASFLKIPELLRVLSEFNPINKGCQKARGFNRINVIPWHQA